MHKKSVVLFCSHFAVAEKLIFWHVNSRLHDIVVNLKIQDRYPLLRDIRPLILIQFN